MFPSSSGESSLLSFKRKDQIWVLKIYLSNKWFIVIPLRRDPFVSDSIIIQLEFSLLMFLLENANFFGRFVHRLLMSSNFLSILASLVMFASFFSQYLMVQMTRLIHQQLTLGREAIWIVLNWSLRSVMPLFLIFMLKLCF